MPESDVKFILRSTELSKMSIGSPLRCLLTYCDVYRNQRVINYVTLVYLRLAATTCSFEARYSALDTSDFTCDFVAEINTFLPEADCYEHACVLGSNAVAYSISSCQIRQCSDEQIASLPSPAEDFQSLVAVSLATSIASGASSASFRQTAVLANV